MDQSADYQKIVDYILNDPVRRKDMIDLLVSAMVNGEAFYIIDELGNIKPVKSEDDLYGSGRA